MGRRQGDPFLVIGVTGGIGSGKSTVSALLAEAGGRVADADALSRAATEPGAPALREIAERFGSDLVDARGQLDRSRLAAVVFSDPERRAALESIVHTRVIAAIDDLVDACRREGYAGLVVLDVPIPVSRGFLDVCDEVWTVEGPEADRVARVRSRSGLPEAQVRARMAAQPAAEAYRALADRVIANDGSPEDLAARVRMALEAARKRMAPDAAPERTG